METEVDVRDEILFGSYFGAKEVLLCLLTKFNELAN